jgi:phospholipid/cholesterol/gamma-HCH transport system substrate-binding protein
MALKISREFKVGFYIVLAISLFYWGFNYLKGNDVFAGSKMFYAIYDNTEGLTKAKSVQINGFQVGLIDDIYFHPDGSGRLVVKIKMELDYPLPEDSRAMIHSSGLLGERNIQLLIGKSSTILIPGDTLASDTESSLSDAVNAQVAPIKAKTEKLLGSLDTAVTLLTGFLSADTRENFKRSFESLNQTFIRLDNSSAILEAYLKNNQAHFSKLAENLESISENLKSNNSNITAVLSNLNAVTDSLKRVNIAQTFAQVDHAVGQLDEVVTKINNGEGTLGQLTNNPQLYNNLEDATSSLDRLLLDIKYNPNKYLQFSVFGSQKYYSDAEIQEIEKELKQRRKEQQEEESDIDQKLNR